MQLTNNIVFIQMIIENNSEARVIILRDKIKNIMGDELLLNFGAKFQR